MLVNTKKKMHIDMNPSTSHVGKKGEQKATQFLLDDGYTIVDCNWRSRLGEIDIIAEKDDVLVFFEVKTVPNTSVDTLEVILGKIKQKKIVETAKRFLQNNRQYKERYIRFDVLIVDMVGFPSVYHIQNAFSEFI